MLRQARLELLQQLRGLHQLERRGAALAQQPRLLLGLAQELRHLPALILQSDALGLLLADLLEALGLLVELRDGGREELGQLRQVLLAGLDEAERQPVGECFHMALDGGLEVLRRHSQTVRDTETQRQRQTEKERETERETERERDRERERQRDRETERQRDRETERQRDRETERQRDRETERQRDRGRETADLSKRALAGLVSTVGLGVLAALMSECWQRLPEKRPTMRGATTRLAAALQERRETQ